MKTLIITVLATALLAAHAFPRLPAHLLIHFSGTWIISQD